MSRKFLIHTSIFVAFFTFIIVERKNSIFLVNDDVILDQIMSGRYTGSPNSGTSFISNIFGILIPKLYLLLGTKYSIFGLLLIFSNFIIILAIIRLANIYQNKFMNWIFLVVFTFAIPVLILSPTFTISSIFLCGIGLIGLFSLINTVQLNKFSLILFVFSIVLGALLRIDAFIGVIIFIFPALLVIFILDFKKIYLKFYFKTFSLIFFLIVGIFAIQNSLLNYTVSANTRYLEYIKFQEVLNTYSPGSLKLHQAIISGDALKNIWSNIDFIILRNWAYADSSVFGFQNMNIGSKFVAQYSGLQGFINSGFFETLNIMADYLESMSLVVLFLISLSIALLFLIKMRYQVLFIYFVMFLSYFTGFYYLAAVLRIPARTSFPLLMIAVVLVATVNLRGIKNLKSPNFYIQISILSLITFFLVIFHTKNEFGYFKLKDQNSSKIQFSSQRNIELEDFSKKAIYIGPIHFFPVANQGIYANNVFWSSGYRTLPLSWATYSPSWYELARILDLDSSSIYNSLARKKEVYWVSDSYLAEILNYYMNDRNILRGKLCSVAKLSGTDQAEIFTFQAKETDC